MNKFFKSIAIVTLSSITIFATIAQAKDDFTIKEGSYIVEFINEDTAKIISRVITKISVDKDGNGEGVYLQTKISKECYKGELKLSQRRDSSGQLIFEVKSSNNTCPSSYYLVKKTQGGFTTHNAVVNPQGIYIKVNEMAGLWIKN